MTRLVVTEGVVLGKRVVGEANTLVAVFTETNGLIKAVAKSARREHSKLRYALEPMTRARFSFVRGKLEWKLVGAEGIARPLGERAESRAAAGRAARLMLRLVHGEEASPTLYRALREGASAIARSRAENELKSIECVLVLRILFNLGYLPKTPELAPFIEGEELSIQLAAYAAARRSMLIRTINESLSATGL